MKTLELHVLSTNPKAFALYKRLGFSPRGLIEKRQGEEAGAST